MKITSEDYIEIKNLVVSYFITTDNADADGFMECWVSPEEFAGYDSGSFGHMSTWQELYEFEKEHVQPGGMANGMRHQATNVHITPVSENEVEITHDMVVINVVDEPRIVATGRYDKSVAVRTDAGWRFKFRQLTVDPGFFKLYGQSPAAEAGG